MGFSVDSTQKVVESGAGKVQDSKDFETLGGYDVMVE